MKFEERRVSIPERRWLLRSAEHGAPESALVVPELPVDSIEYFRAVVLGDDFVEHALARVAPTDEPTFALCERLLSLRGPWNVSASLLDGAAEQHARLGARDEAGAAALVAVVARSREEGEEGARPEPIFVVTARGTRRVHLSLEGRGWLARVEREPG